MRNQLIFLMLVIIVVAAVAAAAASLQVDGGVIQSFEYTVTVPPPAPVSGPAPGSFSCTRSLEHWISYSQTWPAKEITFGNQTYTREEVLKILHKSSTDDATYILAHQLIAAKLNILNGADPSAIQETITAADDWLSQYPLGSDPSGPDCEEAIALAETLEQYNTGALGPGSCTDEDPQIDWSAGGASPKAGTVACELQLDTVRGEAPLDVKFTAAVTVSQDYSETLTYAWQFSEDQSATGELSRSHTYQQPGDYVATFAVVSAADPTAVLCCDAADVSVTAPSADYAVDAGCGPQGTGWLGVNAGTTWVRGTFTGTEESLHFDLEPGDIETFDLDHVVYEGEEWTYAVTSPGGTETGSLTLGPCTELGTVICNPGWSGELGRSNDDKWYVTASGTGARAVRLDLTWHDDQVWTESASSDLGTVTVRPDGTWSMDVAIPGPADGKGQIEVQNQAGEWVDFESCSFEGEAPLGTWITLWGSNGFQAFPEDAQEPQRTVMSWLVSGGWGPEDVMFWWVPCVRRRTDGGETEICGRHLVEPVDQWIRHSGTIVRFYPASALLLDNYVYWPWEHGDDFVYETDSGKVYDLWVAHAGDLYQYAFGRAQIDFVPNPEVVEPGDLFYIRWGTDFRVPPGDPVYDPGTRLREHKAVRSLVVASGEDPTDPTVLESYGWGGLIYNPYHDVGWVPGDGDDSNNLVPEPHHKLDNFDPFDWLNGCVHSVLDALPTWNVKGTIDSRR